MRCAVLLLVLASGSGGLAAVCKEGYDNKAPDLNGGPVMMAVDDPALCRAMCEDHELCGAFVHHTRAHGCLPVNHNTNTSHTNLPPLWPAAQCFLKARGAAQVAPVADPANCSCAGLPRPACPATATPRPCAGACPSGAQCLRRRGFTLPLNGTLQTPSAEACAAACEGRADCLAWSWTSCDAAGRGGSCSLKNLVGTAEPDVGDAIDGSVADTFSCTATKRFAAAPPMPTSYSGDAAQRNSTPWAYLQNPYHRVRHRSGNLRAHDRYNGVAMYVTGNAPHDPIASAESATLFVAAKAASAGGEGKGEAEVLLTARDFDAAGVARSAPLHTKGRLAIAHTAAAAVANAPATAAATVNVTTEYFQVTEHVLAARVTLAAGRAAAFDLHAVVQLDSGAQGSSSPTFDASVAPGPAGAALSAYGSGGPAPGAWAMLHDDSDGTPGPVSHGFYADEQSLRAALAATPPQQQAPAAAAANFSAKTKQLFLLQTHRVSLEAAGGPRTLTLLLARASAQWCNGGAARGCGAAAPADVAMANARAVVAQGEAVNQWHRQAAEDARFWTRAVRLEGAGWPDVWKRGVQYDLNTVRANVRPAVGVFRHPWDAMQVHGPRIVAAETSMDMQTLSYADATLAKDVLYGLYADTAARGQPQVPCQNEDGTTNMECADGYTAGTPPSWGTPLWTVLSIFARDGDLGWLGRMYPLLDGYLQHWLTKRVDAGGYQICMCSWESGQDMMARWGWNQTYGGDNSTRVIRAPEHQAAMAHAAGAMASFARALGHGAAEEARWAAVRDRHVALTRSLWNADAKWFCDYNSATGTWQSGCADDKPATLWNAGAGKQTYQLAPLFFHSPALGVDILGADIAKELEGLVSTVSDRDKFGSDPPGSLTFASYCAASPVDPRCVESIWAPHPFMTISAAGNVNATGAAGETAASVASWASRTSL
eukprot:g7412.t1